MILFKFAYSSVCRRLFKCRLPTADCFVFWRKLFKLAGISASKLACSPTLWASPFGPINIVGLNHDLFRRNTWPEEALIIISVLSTGGSCCRGLLLCYWGRCKHDKHGQKLGEGHAATPLFPGNCNGQIRSTDTCAGCWNHPLCSRIRW